MVGRRGRQQTRHRNNISGCARPEATQRIKDLINMHGMRSTSRSTMRVDFHTGFLTLLDLWPATIGTVLCLSQNTEHKGKHQGPMLLYWRGKWLVERPSPTFIVKQAGLVSSSNSSMDSLSTDIDSEDWTACHALTSFKPKHAHTL